MRMTCKRLIFACCSLLLHRLLDMTSILYDRGVSIFAFSGKAFIFFETALHNSRERTRAPTEKRDYFEPIFDVFAFPWETRQTDQQQQRRPSSRETKSYDDQDALLFCYLTTFIFDEFLLDFQVICFFLKNRTPPHPVNVENFEKNLHEPKSKFSRYINPANFLH